MADEAEVKKSLPPEGSGEVVEKDRLSALGVISDGWQAAYKYAYGVLQSCPDAEDVTQDVAAAFAKQGKLNEKPGLWIAAVKQKLVDLLRWRKVRQGTISLDTVLEDADRNEPGRVFRRDHEAVRQNATPSAEEVFFEEQSPIDLRELAKMVLSEEEQQIYEWLEQGVDNKEIARRLGLRYGTATVRIFRVKEKLGKAYYQEGL